MGAVTLDHFAQELLKVFNPLPPMGPTPVNIPAMADELSFYADKTFSSNLLHSLLTGFDIGYIGPELSNLSTNLKSTYECPEAIFACIQKELLNKRIAGPVTHIPLQNFRTSHIGAVPKKDGTFRMIADPSSPAGLAINDFIPATDSSVQFTGFDEAVNIVARLGKDSLMAKLDIKSAFRICPVRPEDWHLLGFSFCDLYFVDLCLPFGLRSPFNSSPFNRFTRLADTLICILKNNYGLKNIIHYLDGFFLSASDFGDCTQNIKLVCRVFNKLGIPLAPENFLGPLHL